MLADKAEDSEHGRFKGSAQWDSDVLTGSIAGNTNNGITGHYSEKHVSKSKPRQNQQETIPCVLPFVKQKFLQLLTFPSLNKIDD